MLKSPRGFPKQLFFVGNISILWGLGPRGVQHGVNLSYGFLLPFFGALLKLLILFPWSDRRLTHGDSQNYNATKYFRSLQMFSILLLKLYPQKYFTYHYQCWATKLCHLNKSPYPFILWAKSKKPNKFIIKPATRHPLQSPLLHDIHYKSRRNT